MARSSVSPVSMLGITRSVQSIGEPLPCPARCIELIEFRPIFGPLLPPDIAWVRLLRDTDDLSRTIIDSTRDVFNASSLADLDDDYAVRPNGWTRLAEKRMITFMARELMKHIQIQRRPSKVGGQIVSGVAR